MSNADRWTIDLYRAVRRDPAAYPRRVVEFTQPIAAYCAGLTIGHELYPPEVLQSYYDSIVEEFGEVTDERITYRAPHWIQLYTLLVVREELAKRFGPTVRPVFDPIADQVREALGAGFIEVPMHDNDGKSFSTWFRYFDEAFAQCTQREADGTLEPVRPSTPPDEPNDPWGSNLSPLRLQAFIETVMYHDQSSPLYHEERERLTTDGHMDAWVHLGWLEFPTVNIARMYRRQTLEALLMVGAGR